VAPAAPADDRHRAAPAIDQGTAAPSARPRPPATPQPGGRGGRPRRRPDAGRLLAEVAGVLEEADFHRPAHRAIWRAILRLTDRGEPTDPVTVLGELDDSGELADVGGGPFLHTLVQAVPTVASAGRYARLVAETARRRRVIDLGIRLANSDAHPAVLAEVADKLADPTTATHGGRGWEPPVPFGATGNLPAFPVQVLPGWLGEHVAAVATATQTHRIWPACSPSPSWPPSGADGRYCPACRIADLVLDADGWNQRCHPFTWTTDADQIGPSSASISQQWATRDSDGR
jgi:DnaB-like helicase N terminal domain